MFQFPTFAPYQVRWQAFSLPGCPIRKSADQWPFAPTRGLSQLITSFFASESQGIPYALLVTFSIYLLVFSIYNTHFSCISLL